MKTALGAAAVTGLAGPGGRGAASTYLPDPLVHIATEAKHYAAYSYGGRDGSMMADVGEYTLYDKTGAAIELDAPALEEILDLEVGGGAEWTNEGTLVIEVPVYFAVRRAVRVGDDWQTLSDPDELETADAQIGKLFVKSEDES